MGFKTFKGVGGANIGETCVCIGCGNGITDGTGIGAGLDIIKDPGIPGGP